MALSETKKRAILESIAEDEDVKPYQRLQALAQLERLEKGCRTKPGFPAANPESDERPADPMGDLDELAAKRARRAS